MKSIIFLALISLTLALSKPGGWTPRPIDDPKIVELSKKAIAHVNLICNCDFYKKLVGIVMAQVQVVNGINYRILIEVATTKCPKSKPDLKCEIDPKQKQEMCELVFHFKPGSTNGQITEAKCRKRAQ